MKTTITHLPLFLLLLTGCGENPQASVDELISTGSLEEIKERKKALAEQERLSGVTDVALLVLCPNKQESSRVQRKKPTLLPCPTKVTEGR